MKSQTNKTISLNTNCNSVSTQKKTVSNVGNKEDPVFGEDLLQISEDFNKSIEKSKLFDLNKYKEENPTPYKSKNEAKNSEIIFKEILADVLKDFKYNIKHNGYIYDKNMKRQLDIWIQLFCIAFELNGDPFHNIKKLKGDINYHKNKREMANRQNIHLVIYTTSFSSRWLARSCIRHSINRNLLSNLFFHEKFRIKYLKYLHEKSFVSIFELSHWYKPEITLDIDPTQLEFSSDISHQFRMNVVDGFIYDSNFKVGTLVYKSDRYQYPYGKYTSMIQYTIVKNTAYIYKHYDYNNLILINRNTLIDFKNELIKHYKVKKVKYMINSDYENINMFKFYKINSKEPEWIIKTYHNNPIFKSSVVGNNLLCITSQFKIKYKNNKNDYDLRSYPTLLEDPECKIEITEKETLNYCKQDDIAILNSGTIILTL